MIVQLLVAIGLSVAEAPPPASEAMIDAFMAAVPPARNDHSDERAAATSLERQALDRLEKLNPGREAEVRSLVAASRQCKDDASKKAVVESLRATARRLGDEKLERLTAFYRGPDYALFGRLAEREEKDLSETEKAELERIKTAYPLEDFFASMRVTEKGMWSADNLFGALMKCEETLAADLERNGLER